MIQTACIGVWYLLSLAGNRIVYDGIGLWYDDVGENIITPKNLGQKKKEIIQKGTCADAVQRTVNGNREGENKVIKRIDSKVH